MKKTVSLSFLDQSIKDAKYDLYAGNWCFETNYKVGPNVLANPTSSLTTLEAQSIYIDDLIVKVANSLAPVFNHHYQVQFSNRYWRIILFPFLAHWMGSNYYKYLVISSLKDKLDAENATPVFNFVESADVDYQLATEYANCSAAYDSFIHLEFQKIASHIFKENLIINEKRFAFEKITFNEREKSFSRRAKDFLIDMTGYGGSYYLGRIYFFSLTEKILIHLKLLPYKILSNIQSIFQNNFIWREIKSSVQFSSEDIACWTFTPKNDFEAYVKDNLLQAIPNSFKLRIPKQPFIKKVKSITTTDIYSDQDELFYMARIVENGGKWFSPQHGGGYGVSKNFSPHTLLYLNIDKFLTWGWYNHGRYKINAHPVPSPMLSKLPRYEFRDQKDILIVSTSTTKISIRFDSYLAINSRAEYRNVQLDFLNSIRPEFLKHTILREHFLKVSYPDGLNLFLDKNKIRKSNVAPTIGSLNARVVVIDHPGTTPLQTYAMNVPTIMYWSESYFDLTPEAYEDFLPLKKCGLWFISANEAAEFINQNYHRIFEWWNSEEVELAKANFIKKHVLNSKNFLNDWVDFIKENG